VEKMQILGMELWFIVGLIALILFFAVIVSSLLGFIPQDRLPIQSALVLMTFIIYTRWWAYLPTLLVNGWLWMQRNLTLWDGSLTA